MFVFKLRLNQRTPVKDGGVQLGWRGQAWLNEKMNCSLRLSRDASCYTRPLSPAGTTCFCCRSWRVARCLAGTTSCCQGEANPVPRVGSGAGRLTLLLVGSWTMTGHLIRNLKFLIILGRNECPDIERKWQFLKVVVSWCPPDIKWRSNICCQFPEFPSPAVVAQDIWTPGSCSELCSYFPRNPVIVHLCVVFLSWHFSIGHLNP